MKINLQFNEESDGQHSYILTILSDTNKDIYTDIEFFNNGEILLGKTNRIDKPIIKNVSNVFDAIKELIEFINEEKT